MYIGCVSMSAPANTLRVSVRKASFMPRPMLFMPFTRLLPISSSCPAISGCSCPAVWANWPKGSDMEVPRLSSLERVEDESRCCSRLLRKYVATAFTLNR